MKLETNHTRKTAKCQMSENKTTHLKQPMGQKKIISEILKYFEMYENEKTTYRNLYDTIKAVLRITVIAVNAYTRQEDLKSIKDLST